MVWLMALQITAFSGEVIKERTRAAIYLSTLFYLGNTIRKFESYNLNFLCSVLSKLRFIFALSCRNYNSECIHIRLFYYYDDFFV